MPMNKLNINRHHFSKLVWEVVLQHSESFLRIGWPKLREDLDHLEQLRGQAEYNTGSISLSSAFVLYAICNYFRPALVAEVGTFIGKSTLSMARGMEGGGRAAIHTCDYSNEIELDLPTFVQITQYKKQSSTHMFEALGGLGTTADLVALDGRISQEDVALIQAVTNTNTIMVIDDFEGIEKGVANVMLLNRTGYFKNHLLVYPPDESILHRMGFEARSTIALLVPASNIAYTTQ